MNVQLIANVENQDRAQRGKNQAGGVEAIVCRARKNVGDGTPKDRSDDAKYDCPEVRYVDMHHGFRNNSRDQPNQNVPN